MNKKFKILRALIFAFLVFSFLPQKAHALNLLGLGGNLLLDAVGVIGFIFGFFTNLFMQLVVLIGNLALQLQAFIIENPFVEIGWAIVRDVANLGFVLIIIVIALATILRREQYGAQKLLPKLIAAAILVNFSLTLGGVIINATQVATNFFFSNITENRGEILGRLFGALSPQKYFSSPQIGTTGGIDDFSEQSLNRAMGPWFMAIFNLIGAYVLLTLAILLIVRFVYLSFLLITAPIVWLFWVIPDLSKEFGKWWSQFINWSLFAPAAAFFVYLAFRAHNELSRFELNGTTVGGSLTAQGMNPLIASILIPGVNGLLLLGLLIGGMIAAKNIAPKGAQGVIGFANKVGNNVKNQTTKWAGRQATKAGLAASRGVNIRGKQITPNMQLMAEKMQGSRIKAVSWTGSRISDIAGKQHGENLIKNIEKDQGKFSDRELALRLNSMGRDQQIAALTKLTKNGTLGLVPGGVGRFIADPKTKKIFENYSKGKDYGEMEKRYGSNTAMLTGKDNDGKKPTDKEGNELSPEEIAQKFFGNFSPEDFSKMRKEAIIKDEKEKDSLNTDEMRTMRIKMITEVQPGALAKLLP